MKKVLIFLLVVYGQSVHAQRDRGDQQVPRTVQQNFHKQYPDARDTRWSSSGGDWHADFTDHSPADRGEMVAHYDHSGHHIDSHIPYDRNDVPTPVVRHIEQRYPGGSDHSYTRIERPGKQPLFQISLNLNGKRTHKYVDDQGREKNYEDHH
jgi:hypothetical protein